QLMVHLQGLLVKLADLVDDPNQLDPALLGQLFADQRIVEDDHVAYRDRAVPDLFSQREDLLDHQRRSRERLRPGALAALDALGDLDFAFPREQRYRAHLAQIHADGIVGLLTNAWRQLQVEDFLALFELFVELRLRILEDL